MCDKIPDRECINPSLLKKYISYARHTVFPKLSIEACEVLKAFYINLRENASTNQNTLPITSRCLDSLIRLSQARAKSELRTIVSREDAIDVVKLVQESIFEACFSDMGLGGNGGGKFTPMQMSQGLPPQARGKGGVVDQNNVSMMSIPKQTKLYVERL
jgi:DNA helicase MCM8